MIDSVLRVILDDLNQYIALQERAESTIRFVDFGHIALVDGMSSASEGTLGYLALSVVNIEEEKRLKNFDRITKTSDTFTLQNPPITLNLYVLFSASLPNYEVALRRLSQVITFFQGKCVFTVANTPSPRVVSSEELADMKVILDIHTLNFEQINDLWGSLGGKQVPFVMYRARLVQLKREVVQMAGPLIEQINGTSNGG